MALVVSDVGIEKIVVPIASDCEHFSRGTFSTASTLHLRGAVLFAAVPLKRWLGMSVLDRGPVLWYNRYVSNSDE